MSSASFHEISANCLRALGADPAQRLHQPVGMMDALGVARDLLADHARGVVVAHASRARGRCVRRRAARPPARRCWCSRAGRPTAWSGCRLLGAAPDPYGRIGMIVGGHMVDAPRELPQHIAQPAHGNTPHPPRHRGRFGRFGHIGARPRAAGGRRASRHLRDRRAVRTRCRARPAAGRAPSRAASSRAHPTSRTRRSCRISPSRRPAPCGPARSGWDRTRWMTRRRRPSAIAAGAKRVRPEGVPVWRDGTAPFGQSLYYRGVWAALALLIGLGSVSMAVFNSGRLTMVHIASRPCCAPRARCSRLWQILLIVLAAQRTRSLAVRPVGGDRPGDGRADRPHDPRPRRAGAGRAVGDPHRRYGDRRSRGRG